MESPTDKKNAFTSFVAENEPNLRRALVAWYGGSIGREAIAEALAWGWQHWDRLRTMDNPSGYLFRIGQTHARRVLRRRRLNVALEDHHDSTWSTPWVEPELTKAIESLTRRQRTVVVLVHGYDLSHTETAELLGIRRSTVQNHVERGMAKLREFMEVPSNE